VKRNFAFALALITGAILLTGLSARALPRLEPIPFFRSPTSEFPSGHASMEDLVKSFASQKIQKQVVAQKKNQPTQKFNFKENEMITARHLLTFESPLSPRELRLIFTATPLTETRLRKEPHWRAESLAKIHPFEKIQIRQVKDSTWVLVQLQNSGGSLQGYVDINDLILKTDFASHVLLKDKAWHPVAYRDGSELVLAQNKQRVPLGEVLAVLPRMNEGISLVQNASLRKNERLEILSTAPQEWLTSQLRGHGEVYWQRPVNTTNSQASLTTEEILKKPIYSIAQNPKNPNHFVVASEGLFMTRDGQTWQEIPSFRGENLPVAFGPKGEIYVGSHRSLDAGHSFSPYLRWPDLIQVIHRESQMKPSSLKMSGIEFLGQDLIKIKISTEQRHFRLIAKTHPQLIQKWELQ
jgi:hypothetical protein